MVISTGFDCPHCGEHSDTSARHAGHISNKHRAQHKPGRAWPKAWTRIQPSGARPNLKRDTDTWPGRP